MVKTCEGGERSEEGQRAQLHAALGILCVPRVRWSPLLGIHQHPSGTHIRGAGSQERREGGRQAGQVPLPSLTVTDTTVQLARKEAGCQGRAELGPCQVCRDSGRCCPTGREETVRFGVSTQASD